MEDFKVIDSQEVFDQRIGDRLKRERQKVEAEYAEKLEALVQENKALKSEVAEAKVGLDRAGEKDKEIEALKGQVAGYERSELKRKVALEHDIPYKLAERIRGESEEEMIEDAKSLAAYFAKDEPIPPLKNPDMGADDSGAYKDLLDGLNLDD